MTILDDHKSDFERVIELFNQDIKSLRTGRATPALIENISVLAYGTPTPILQLASVQAPDPQTLIISPWDKSVLKEVEKSLQEANLGLGVVNKGDAIYLTVPAMTEEKRLDLVKKVKEKSEQYRIQIRGHRDNLKELINAQEKAKELTEDDKFRLQKDLDELTGEYNDKIKKIVDQKEEEIMRI